MTGHVRKAIAIAALSSALCLHVAAQDLSRRAWHGLALSPTEGGLKVESVQPGGSAERAGVQAGDVVVSINGQALKAAGDVNGPALRTLPSGAALTYAITRGGKAKALKARAVARAPEDPGAGLEGIYGAVAFQGGLLRSHITKPSGPGRLPAVLFVQGYPCASYIDIAAEHPYRRLTTAMAKAGFLVMRVEKPGIGDSRGGPACESIDLDTEAAAFGAALADMKARADVAPQKIFVFGHSLGAITGLMAAQGQGIKGMAVYGITPEPWFEYYLKLQRVQTGAMAEDLQAHERDTRRLTPLIYTFMVEKKPPAEITANDPELAELFKTSFGWDGARTIAGRDIETYWDLNEVNQAKLWGDLGVPTLAMFGTADIQVMSYEGTRTIARFVNQSGKAPAFACQFTGVNHSFAQMGPMDAEYALIGKPDYGKTIFAKYDPGPEQTLIAWMQGVLEGDGAPALPSGLCEVPK
jgi:hypothetical protein